MADKLFKKVNICLLSLLLLLTVSMLSGCGIFTFNRVSDGEDSEVSESETDTESEKYRKYNEEYSSMLDSFSKYFDNRDYGGGACKIAVAGRNVITADENTSTVLSAEFEERNGAVGDRMKLSIVSESTDADTMFEMLRQSSLSGDYYADLVMIPQSKISAFAASGIITNLRSMPSFDYNARFLYASSVAAGGGGAAVYGVAGPASLEPDALSGVFFNKGIIDSLGLESPYNLVSRGEWTIDKYVEYASAASAAGYYSYGAQNTSGYLTDLFYFSAGGRLVDFQVGQYPMLALNNEQSYALAGAASSAVNIGGAVYDGAIDSFAAGGTAFLVEKLSCMKILANAACDWGLLPLPKYSVEQQNYSSLANSEDALFFALPISAPNYTMSGDVMNAVNIMSYGYTTDAYISDAVYYYLRDNASAKMMSIILSNPMYDGAYTFSDRDDAVGRATFGAIRNNTYGVESVESAVGYWADSFNNSMYNNFTVD